MKRFGNIQFTWLLLFCSIGIFFSLASCNQKKDKSEVTAYEGKNNDDTIVHETIQKDTHSASPKVVEPTPKETPTYNPATPKKCDPNFNLIASPKKNQQIYYVSGFNPGEFKCWAELENHGVKICGGSPCMIYYLDKANVTVTSTPPHYIDVNTLKSNGIGRFEYNGAWWEIKGSNMWGRKDKGYGYYNTDHAGGG